MNRKSFVLYLDLLGSLDQLSDAQAGKLFKAIKAYHMSVSEGATQECKAEFDCLMDDFVTRLAFHPFRATFERDAERYQGIVDRNRRNGKKGGRKKDIDEKTQTNPKNPVGYLGTQTNPKEPKQSHNDNDSDNDNNITLSGDKVCQPDKQADPAPPPLPESEVPYRTIMDFWNKAMSGRPIACISALTATSKRGINVRGRFRECGLEKIYQVIINASESLFLNGHNSRGWTATFDWAFLPSNFLKILDGNYRNKDETTTNYRSDSPRGGIPIKGRIVPACGLKRPDQTRET